MNGIGKQFRHLGSTEMIHRPNYNHIRVSTRMKMDRTELTQVGMLPILLVEITVIRDSASFQRHRCLVRLEMIYLRRVLVVE